MAAAIAMHSEGVRAVRADITVRVPVPAATVVRLAWGPEAVASVAVAVEALVGVVVVVVVAADSLACRKAERSERGDEIKSG